MRLLPEVVGQLDQAGRDLGIRVFGIKGLVARDYYPDPAMRQIGDWDVYVESEAAAWELTGWLRRHGYVYYEKELPWYKRDLNSGRFYGQMLLRRSAGEANIFVDIHYGGYSVRHCALLDVRVPSAGPGWHLIDRTQNVALSVANASGDQFITAKDLNDLFLALEDKALDWDAIKADIASAGLQGFFNNMLSRVTEIYDLSADAARAASVAAFPGAREPLPPLWEPDSSQRRSVTIRHAYDHGRRHSLVRGIVSGATAARYYRADLQLRIVARRRAPLPKARPWTCVRLVPVPLAARSNGAAANGAARPVDRPGSVIRPLSPNGAMRRVRTPSGDLVEAAGELFLPTVYFGVSKDLVRSGTVLDQQCTT